MERGAEVNIPELIIGHEYVQYSQQWDVSNHLIFLGGDAENAPDWAKATGDFQKGKIGYFKYSRRLKSDPDRWVTRQDEIDRGREEYTETHQKGRLVS